MKTKKHMKKFVLGAIVLYTAWAGRQVWKYYQAATYTAHNMKEVSHWIQKETAGYRSEDVLCCFDIDDTLIWLDYPPLSFASLQKHKKIFQSLQKRYPQVTKSVLYINLKSHVRMTDPDFLSIRPFLPPQTIAFTASGTGKCLGQYMTTLRYKELKRFGISFENAFPFSSRSIDSITFEDGNHPEYVRGILFSSSQLRGTGSKGAVLCAFLKTLPHLPQCVLLVDDRRTNHATVQQHLRQQFPHIRWVGILYQGTHRQTSSPVSEKEFTSSMEALFAKANAFLSSPERQNFIERY